MLPGSGLKRNPSIRFVVLKHVVQLQGGEGGGFPTSLAAAELESSFIAKLNVQFQ